MQFVVRNWILSLQYTPLDVSLNKQLLFVIGQKLQYFFTIANFMDAMFMLAIVFSCGEAYTYTHFFSSLL